MSKSRRNKNKHSADARKGGKKPDAPTVGETVQADGIADDAADESGFGMTDESSAEAIFSASEASAADAQILAEEMAHETSQAEAALDIAAADGPDQGAADTALIEVDAPVAGASPAAANEETSAPVVQASAAIDEPADRGGRRGKRHEKPDKPAPAPAPLAPVEMVAPAIPRAPAMAQLGEYERLSLAHVAGTPQQSDAPGHWRGVGFRLGTRRLAAAFDEVVEILSMPQVTHVPGAQPWMLGVANVRGTLLPVVDLKQFLEGERTVIHEAQRILVVRQSGGDVAVLIDELYGQRSFNDSQAVSLDEETGRYGYFVKQMYRVGDFDWGVFSMSMLTRTPEFRQAAA
jgi:twitching motility protein PilI